MSIGSFQWTKLIMDKSIFNPENQQSELSSKIIAGLERVSQAFKVMLWEKAKHLGISPIQIQILIFVAHHRASYNNVSFLAQEFNVTKPTISDAVKVLHKKGFIEKDYSPADNRSYTIFLTEKGKEVVAETDNFADPMAAMLDKTSKEEKENLFKSLSELIYRLNQQDILTVQRICFACKFYEPGKDHHYCRLLEKNLKPSDIRLDCNEFEAKT